jgi:hypothetical protein
MRDLDDEKRIKEYMAAKMKHIKMYHECMNLADGLDVAKFAELVRADEREKCAKREWVGLTDEEIDGIYKTHHDQYGKCQTGGFEYERTIEAKLKEKNT